MSQKFKPLSRSFHLWSGLIKVIVAKNLLNICRLLISNSQRCQLVERNLALFLFCSLTSTNRFANCMRRFLCAQYFTIKLPPLLLFDFVFLLITFYMSNSQLNISKDSFFCFFNKLTTFHVHLGAISRHKLRTQNRLHLWSLDWSRKEFISLKIHHRKVETT